MATLRKSDSRCIHIIYHNVRDERFLLDTRSSQTSPSYPASQEQYVIEDPPLSVSHWPLLLQLTDAVQSQTESDNKYTLASNYGNK